MLFRLAYYSRNLIKKSSSPRQSELRKIVASAGLNNRALGITGGLMFNRDYFGQVLEGERAAVSALFCSIAKDPRHCSLVIVKASAVEERLFDRWAMGLAEKNETAEKLNSKFGLDHGFDPSQISAADFTNYILEMVSIEDQLISVSIPTWVTEGSAAGPSVFPPPHR
jgi:Sensors of blue-light using FAD